jgi:SAM-dependent methyltransferase
MIIRYLLLFRGCNYYLTNRNLVRLVSKKKQSLILDVGGRKSPYSLGINGVFEISELPKITEVQKKLNLGLDSNVLTDFKKRKNIKSIIFDDMCQTKLQNNTYDGVVSVEVIEHILDDVKFVENISKVLKPTGWFLLTTPNGEKIANTNPDHKRHYSKESLSILLENYFEDVRVDYTVKTGFWRVQSLKSFKHAFSTFNLVDIFIIPLASCVNIFQTKLSVLHSLNTAHLSAICSNPKK